MDLHPDAAAYLEELSRLNLPDTSGGDVQAIRTRYSVLCSHFAGTRIAMERIEETAGPVPMRRYVPEGSVPERALVWFHGGRMISGSLDTHDAACRMLAAASGWTVLSVDYRLGPEHPFPAAVDDAEAAVRFALSGHGQVAVGGDSAGGSLALDAALQCSGSFRGPGSLRALLLVYPMLDATMSLPSHAEFARGPWTSSADIAAGYDLWLPEGCDRRSPRVSPRFAEDLSGLPPSWILVSGIDPLRDEGLEIARRIRAAGVRAECMRVERQIHGFLTYPKRFAAAREAAGSIASFLASC